MDFQVTTLKTTLRCSILLHAILLFLTNLLLSSHASSAASFGKETDKLALLDFKRQITNDPHGILSSWNDSQHFCQWQGGLSLYGPISPSIGNLSFLRAMNLQDNIFHGELPQEISLLFRLRHLNLTNNTIGGEVPVNLSRCAELRVIDLYQNNLVGVIPPEIGYLKNLVRLMLGTNHLTGSIPPSFGNLTSLRQISLATNIMEGSIPSEMGQLRNLTFFAMAINNLTGTVPFSLYNISTLSVFSVADNQLTGSLPPNIGLTLPNLRRFGIGQNQFSGTIPVSFTNASNLQLLDLPENNFVGQVPPHLGALNLLWLNLGSNFLGSNQTNDLSFVASLSNCTNLQILYLDDNNFGGEIPNSISNLSSQLAELSLGGNYLTGIIQMGIENLSNLFRLALSNNLLSGTIPSYFGKFQNLQTLILYRNKLHGHVPPSFGNLTQLYRLRLSDNELDGNIPSSLGNCQNLNFLDMSQNEFTGFIPLQVVSISSLSISLNLSHNSLNGSLPREVGRLKNINALDVSENKLSGDIPQTIGDCSSLEYLYMQGNFLQGTIPSTLASLKSLRELDLSRNNLSKTIPKDLVNLPFLQYLNLSFNELEGEVPTEGVFRNASAISVVGNSKLCGGIHELRLPLCLVEVKKQKKQCFLVPVIIIVCALMLCIVVISFATMYWRRRRRKEASSKDSMKDRILRISYNELYHATTGFSADKLIGSGGFGSVYEGTLNKQEEERLVAVKVLNLQNSKASKSFMTECKALRNIRHRNLVKILTYCSSMDFKGNEFKALVYEFMAKGSLDTWLHPEVGKVHSSRPLNFLQRLNIAIDVASALHYLHDLCETPIIHCDLKPSNILLDSDLIAHVGDFGLARLLPNTTTTNSQEQISSIGIKGSTGYSAPEYGMGGEASKHGDVYSYGILLLEMLTGRRPTDDMFNDGLYIHTYAKQALPEHVMEIVDPTILVKRENVIAQVEDGDGYADKIEVDTRYMDIGNSSHGGDNMLKCIASVMKVGVACSAELPNERPDMNHILKVLHLIRDRDVFIGAEISKEA